MMNQFTTLRQLVPFLVLMVNCTNKERTLPSPDYIIEKCDRAMNDRDCFRMLDKANQQQLLSWLQHWQELFPQLKEIFTPEEINEINGIIYHNDQKEPI